MNHVIIPHSKPFGVIELVPNDIPARPLRHTLLRASWGETASLLDIENAPVRVTAQRQMVESLREFFAGWSKTNNLTTSVFGLANRLTLLTHSGQSSATTNQLH